MAKRIKYLPYNSDEEPQTGQFICHYPAHEPCMTGSGGSVILLDGDSSPICGHYLEVFFENKEGCYVSAFGGKLKDKNNNKGE